tara:strand:+ start:1736 stop:2050 length:315 start_codon:yes stop_codon:yes gene_type:complete
MTTIYCIEDINDLKYVGSTKQKLSSRLSQHKYRQRVDGHYSSKYLNLYNSIIYPLEICDDYDIKSKEAYWIKSLSAVNIYKLDYNESEHKKEYYRKIKSKQNKE